MFSLTDSETTSDFIPDYSYLANFKSSDDNFYYLMTLRMFLSYNDDVKVTFGLFEIWARSKTSPEVWTKHLNVEDQKDLELFAKFQSYVVKSFKIIHSLKTKDRKVILESQGSTRLATRWLIWSNTCFKIDFLP